MKIVLTGSLGNISKPLTQTLVRDGHQVTLISSDPNKKEMITAMGAIPAIGSIADLPFLIKTFAGADIAYCMTPLNFQAPNLNFLHEDTDNYIQAIKETGIKRVIVLSGWVVHLLDTIHPEEKFEQLTNVALTFVRPGPFFNNFYHYKDMIRHQGRIESNYGGQDLVAFIAPEDIADAIAAEINEPTATGSKVTYVVSEELTCNQAAKVMGTAIGIPDLQWVVVPDEQVKQGLETSGVSADIANLLIEMQANMHNGKAQKDYKLSSPVVGKRKLSDFAKAYALWYHQN